MAFIIYCKPKTTSGNEITASVSFYSCCSSAVLSLLAVRVVEVVPEIFVVIVLLRALLVCVELNSLIREITLSHFSWNCYCSSDVSEEDSGSCFI